MADIDIRVIVVGRRSVYQFSGVVPVADIDIRVIVVGRRSVYQFSGVVPVADIDIRVIVVGRRSVYRFSGVVLRCWSASLIPLCICAAIVGSAMQLPTLSTNCLPVLLLYNSIGNVHLHFKSCSSAQKMSLP